MSDSHSFSSLIRAAVILTQLWSIPWFIRQCQEIIHELLRVDYRISMVKGRRSFFSFQNNSKNLDPSYKTDLDLWDYLGRVKLVLEQNFKGLI